jgi:hypothetical protein
MAVVLALPDRAWGAIELWQSDDGLRVVEIAPSLKLFMFGATGFMEAPEGMSADWPLPSVGGGTLGRLRLRFLADLTSRIRFGVHYEHRPRVLSNGFLLSAASDSLQGDETVPLRITPLQWEIAAAETQDSPVAELLGGGAPTFVWEHEIDRLFLVFSLPRADITVGRQAVGWGMGRLWSPLDVFAPLTATDLDREERRGIDAIRLTLPFSPTSFMEVVVAAGHHVDDEGEEQIRWRDSAAAWLLRGLHWGIEWMVMAGKVGADVVYGGGLMGQILGVALRGEVTRTTDENRESAVRATAGIEFGTSINLSGIIEYHYNGFGTLDTDDYLSVATEQASRLSRGMVSGLGQHYAGLTLMYQPLPNFSASFVYLQNCQDGSLMLGPAIDYVITDEVRLALAAFVPIGRSVRWDTSSGIPQPDIRSEYGASPQLYVLQLRINL